MSKQLQRDFTEGSIPRHLLFFSMPMLAGSLLQALYNTVDAVWVGRFLGAGALGAVSISFPLIMALFSMVFGLTMASSTLVAQYRGARQEERVHRTVATSLLLLTGLGILLSAAGFLLRYPLLALVNPPESIRDQAASYFGLFMAGIIGMFLYNVLASLLRGLGDSKTPLKFLAMATAFNIVVDPLLIFGVGPLPELGVGGAAIATGISQGLSAWLLWRWMVRHTDLLPRTREEWKPDWEIMRLILKIGVPTGLQQVLVSFGMVAVTAIISGFGADAVAAFGAASRIDQFGFMPAMALGMAATAIAGQNMGAGRFDRVAATVRWGLLMGGGLTAVVSLVAFSLPAALLSLFSSDPGVLKEGSAYLRIIGPAYIFFALVFIVAGVIRGAGDTLASMVMSLTALWLLRVPLAWFLSREIGVVGVWWAVGLSAAVAFFLHWAYYLTGRWKRKVVVQPQLTPLLPPDGAPAAGD